MPIALGNVGSQSVAPTTHSVNLHIHDVGHDIHFADFVLHDAEAYDPWESAMLRMATAQITHP